MNYYKTLCLVIVTVLFLFCSAVVAQPPAAKKAAPVVAGTAVISNGITVHAKGLTVQQAYLVFEDDTRLPAGNKIKINQTIILKMILSKGFKEIGGKVFPGGKQKIALSTGETILDSDDLFTAFDKTGVSPEAARYIALKAQITGIKDKKNYVLVSFRVWDKKSSANEITGLYKLYIQ